MTPFFIPILRSGYDLHFRYPYLEQIPLSRAYLAMPEKHHDLEERFVFRPNGSPAPPQTMPIPALMPYFSNLLLQKMRISIESEDFSLGSRIWHLLHRRACRP